MIVRQGGWTTTPQLKDPMLLRDVLAECEAILALTNHLTTQESEH